MLSNGRKQRMTPAIGCLHHEQIASHAGIRCYPLRILSYMRVCECWKLIVPSQLHVLKPDTSHMPPVRIKPPTRPQQTISNRINNDSWMTFIVNGTLRVFNWYVFFPPETPQYMTNQTRLTLSCVVGSSGTADREDEAAAAKSWAEIGIWSCHHFYRWDTYYSEMVRYGTLHFFWTISSKRDHPFKCNWLILIYQSSFWWRWNTFLAKPRGYSADPFIPGPPCLSCWKRINHDIL